MVIAFAVGVIGLSAVAVWAALSPDGREVVRFMLVTVFRWFD